tara:strand:+ start:11166 stop:13508 length:2343 start_codon:yes stop_codon:yes gene_type:complete
VFNHHNRRPPILEIRGSSEKVLAPEDLGAEIRNFVRTAEGTLRSVVGPCLYENNEQALSGNIEGLFHHTLESGREILLAHVNQKVYEHQGWANTTLLTGWKVLVEGDGGLSTAPYQFPLRKTRGADFLTQFVGTPAGVVIIPQDDDGYGSAKFFDGDIVGPLGFAESPAPPEGKGPQIGAQTHASFTSSKYQDTGNTRGYHLATQYAVDDDSPEGVIAWPPVYGTNRIGTVKPYPSGNTSSSANPHGGSLNAGEWRCKAQLQDIWGNRSPLSAASNGVLCFQEDNISSGRTDSNLTRSAERLKVQLSWRFPGRRAFTNLQPLEGVNLYRTKDLNNSGDPDYYHLIDYAASGQLAIVTLPGVTTSFYPDNIPDVWLSSKAVEVDPMPEFKVACWSLGRLWIGNIKGDPGRIQSSYPGFPGTMMPNSGIYPDTANEVTALHAISGGLLAFTRTSTFRIRPNDTGGNLEESISTSVGCVSPDSVQTLEGGAVVWLSESGFFAWMPGGEGPIPISEDIRRTISRINTQWACRAVSAYDADSREYRCWIPVDGSERNNECCVFNGDVWSFRDEVLAEAVCSQGNNENLILALGSAKMSITGSPVADFQAVYVLDRDRATSVAASASELRESVIETAWMRVPLSDTKAGIVRLLLLMRETYRGDMKLELMRDWRERVIQKNDVGEPGAPKLYPTDDEASYWGSAVVDGSVERRVLEDVRTNPGGEDSTRWDRRRPFWQKVDLYVPDCECFKIRFTFTGDAEFVGIKYVEQTPGTDIGHNSMPGGAA